MGKGLEWTLFQGTYTNGHYEHEKILNAVSLVVREIKIRTRSYHFTLYPSGWLI